MASLRLDNLGKTFGTRVAVQEVSLEIADGEFVVFVGPSGCGKTTTLNIIAGLERPTTGDVWIGGDRVTDWEPRDRNLGMVFQSLALFPHDRRRQHRLPLMIEEIGGRESRRAGERRRPDGAGRAPAGSASGHALGELRPSRWPWRSS